MDSTSIFACETFLDMVSVGRTGMEIDDISIVLDRLSWCYHVQTNPGAAQCTVGTRTTAWTLWDTAVVILLTD